LKTACGLIDKLHIINDSHIDDFIAELINTQQPRIVGFLNQHGYNLAAEDKEVLTHFSQIDYLLRDGVGIKWACRWFNQDPGLNLNGTDFIPSLIKQANDSDIAVDYFVFGTRSPWLENGAQKLVEGRSVNTLNGFLEASAYTDCIHGHSQPDALSIVVLGMGMPKQERLAPFLRQAAKGPILVICGGAIIDFQANRFDRAPEFFRRFNLEWLYRFLREPRRLFGRYVLGIPKFFYYLLAKK
jgi:exopolysaccharide biosynthesis WecB/TagA/CpsF family protein